MNLGFFDDMQLGEKIWLGIGLGGQLCFASRFLIQWIASESKQRSHIPISFWYLSLAGGIVLLSYAIWRRDPVFIIGQAFGGIVYVRNLMLLRRERAESADRQVLADDSSKQRTSEVDGR
jgi:lipid-A-disaccharide synthase-like uncharacterized protein